MIDEDRTFTYAESPPAPRRRSPAPRRRDRAGRARGRARAQPERGARGALRRAGGQGLLCAVNTRLAAAEIATIIEHSRRELVLFDPRLRPPRRRSTSRDRDRRRLRGAPRGGPRRRRSALAGRRGAPHRGQLHERHDGQPKGVLYTHRGAYLNALGEVVETGLNVDRRYLWTLPMFHCNGWCYPWAVTAVGATHVCIPRPIPPRVARAAARHHASVRGADRARLARGAPRRRAARAAAHGRTAGAPLRRR